MFVTGATRTGKSTLAKELFLSAAEPRLVIDPNDSSLTAVAGAVTFRDPKRIPDAGTLRFVPVDPADRAAYNEVYRWAFERFPRYVWLDEPDQAAPASGFPRWCNTYVAQGAKRGLGHLTCATGPRWVMKSLLRNTQHLIMFDLPVADDRAYLANMVGIPLALLEESMRALQEKGFLWWNQLERQLTICPPLAL